MEQITAHYASPAIDLLLVPSQTHGLMLPTQEESYFPTWVKFAVKMATGLLLFRPLHNQ